MKHFNIAKNERGITLVEILAALVILGIVFVGFMTVFPQMTNFNAKTENKLVAMNDARTLLDSAKTIHSYSDFTLENGYSLVGNQWVKRQGEVEYRINKNPALSAGGAVGESNLHTINIKITRNGKVISETFGYIEVKY